LSRLAEARASATQEEDIMRTAVTVACLLLSIAVAAPSLAAPDDAKSNRKANTTATRKKPAAVKPTWEACFAMSVDRGFNHDIEEWYQSIEDCQQGKIPL
jgi:hypothetical protein